MASKRLSLCIDEKVLLIRAIQAGEKIGDVGKRFGFSRSTVSTIWKNKDKILQAKEDGKSFKKIRKPKYEDLDQAMLKWFHRQRQNNKPVSGLKVKAKAEKISKELGLTGFKASEGWLGSFKQRHHISFGKNNEEGRCVDTNVTRNWINKVWPKLKEKYAPRDISNANEAGISYKSTPDKTLIFKEEKCVRRKFSKTHQDAGFCINSASGEIETRPDSDYENDFLLTECVQQFNIPQKSIKNLQTCIELDDSLATTASLKVEEILDSVRKTKEQRKGDKENEMNDPEPPPSIKQALDAAKLLEKYFLYNEVDPTVSEAMNEIFKKIQLKYWSSKKSQTEITDCTR